MTRQILNDGETYGVIRGKINSNFLELYSGQLTSGDVLLKNNNTPYVPTNPYNPATKDYIDSSIQSNVISIYDPLSIQADAFDRGNHHSMMSAIYISQDADNRLVTDVEKNIWSNKEDSIGSKGTAFNKNFGTISGTVATGDHVHTGTYEPFNANIQTHIATTTGNPHNVTKAEVGLSLVDNIGNSNRVYNDFTPQTEANYPLYQQGRLFYDSTNDSLAVYNGVSNLIQQLGQEFFVRVWNDSGADISVGAAVVFSGNIKPTSGEPSIKLAVSDTLSNANVTGIATHTITNGGVGFVVCIGNVHGVDTSSFTAGDILYLSDTVAGSFRNTPPDIPSICAVVVKADVVGQIFVRITPNIVLPTTVGFLEGLSSPISVTTSYQNIVNYTSSDAIISAVDTSLGTIGIPASRKYRATLNLSISFTSSAQTRTITLQLWDVDSTSQLAVKNLTIPIDTTIATRSISALFDGIQGNDIVVRILADIAISVTFDDMSFEIVSV